MRCLCRGGSYGTGENNKLPCAARVEHGLLQCSCSLQHGRAVATPSALQVRGEGKKLSAERPNSVSPAPAQRPGSPLLSTSGRRRKEKAWRLGAVGGTEDIGGDKWLKSDGSSKVGGLSCPRCPCFPVVAGALCGPRSLPARCRSILPSLETFHSYWANKLRLLLGECLASPKPDPSAGAWCGKGGPCACGGCVGLRERGWAAQGARGDGEEQAGLYTATGPRGSPCVEQGAVPFIYHITPRGAVNCPSRALASALLLPPAFQSLATRPKG